MPVIQGHQLTHFPESISLTYAAVTGEQPEPQRGLLEEMPSPHTAFAPKVPSPGRGKTSVCLQHRGAMGVSSADTVPSPGGTGYFYQVPGNGFKGQVPS